MDSAKSSAKTSAKASARCVRQLAAKPGWVVELNIGGCRISRRARRRRHLLGLRSPALRLPPLRPSGAA